MSSITNLIIASAIVTTFVVVPVAYMAADRQQPYEYISGEISPYVVKPGQVATIHWRLKINRKCRGLNQRQVIDSTGRIINYDPTIALGTSVSEDYVVAFEVPFGMSPGPAKYRVMSTYNCNLVQTIWPLQVTTPDIGFAIGSP